MEEIKDDVGTLFLFKQYFLWAQLKLSVFFMLFYTIKYST